MNILHHWHYELLTCFPSARLSYKATEFLFPDRANRKLSYLYLPWHSGAVHPAGHINRVSPDVILRSPCPDHPCNHWTHVDAWANRRKREKRNNAKLRSVTTPVWLALRLPSAQWRTYPLSGRTHCTTDSWFHPKRQTFQWRSRLLCSDGRKQIFWPVGKARHAVSMHTQIDHSDIHTDK